MANFIIIISTKKTTNNRKHPMKWKSALLLSLFLSCITCMFQSASTIFPFNHTIKSWDIAGTHMAILTDQPTPNIQFYDFTTLTHSLYPYFYPDSLKISTHETNNDSSYCFAIYGGTYGVTFKSYNSLLCNLMGFSTISVDAMGFGSSPAQLFTAQFDTVYSFASFATWRTATSTTISTTYTSNTYTIQNSSNILQQIYYNSTQYYTSPTPNTASQKSLIIYRQYPPGSIPAFYITFLYTNCTTISIDVYLDYLVVLCDDRVEVRNASAPFRSVWNFTVGFVGDGVAAVGGGLVVKGGGGVGLFSLPDGVLLDSANYTLSAGVSYIKRVGTNGCYLFSNTTGIMYNISMTNKYILPAPTPPPPAIPIPSSPSPSTQINSTAPTATPNQLRTGSQIVGNALSLLSLRLTMQSNVPLSLFLEQFWLYKYYVDADYPEAMATFMQEIQIVNLLKLKPSFLEFLTPNYSIGAGFYYQQVYLSNGTTYSPLYYSEEVKQFCTVNLVINIFFYAFIRLCLKLFRKPHRSSVWILKAIHGGLRERGHWWSLLLGIVEPDFLALCFYSLNQMALPFCFAFENKLNLAASFGAFLFLILFATSGYSLLYESYRSKAKDILLFSKDKSIKSYYLESAAMLLIKLFKSFAHSAFFSRLSHKYLLLSSLDLCLLAFILLFRRSFCNSLYFCLYLLYQAGVGTIDLLLALKSLGVVSMDAVSSNFCFGGILVALLIFTLAKMAVAYYKGMKAGCAEICGKKITPEENLSPKEAKTTKIIDVKQEPSHEKADKGLKLKEMAQMTQKRLPKNLTMVRVKTFLKAEQKTSKQPARTRIAGRVKISP